MQFSGYVYYITRITNLPSIIERGILSHNECGSQRITHQSFALDSVQEKRHMVTIPNGDQLHNYACLYFDARNKTMFTLRKNDNQFGQICVLVLDAQQLLQIPNAVISDMNAAASLVNFYSATDLNVLDFARIYDPNWNHADENEKRLHGYQKCAELLIPTMVNPSHILGAYVQNKEMGNQISDIVPKVKVNKSIFFL